MPSSTESAQREPGWTDNSFTEESAISETQQQCKSVISNVTFKAVKSMDHKTTDTKARRWSIRGLKGLIFPLAAIIIEERKMNKKSHICRLLESYF